MVMPIDLVLVRHGESEGNYAHDLARNGDNSAFKNKDFCSKHSSLWRLTDIGKKQAEITGKYLREHFGTFDAFYTSEYVRAMETAALLNLPHAKWVTDFYLRERDWGQLDPLSHAERKKQHKSDLERRERDSFFWAPPAGESLANVCLRLSRVIERLHRECSDKRVIIVCHGEVMWAFRVILERMSQSKYRELDMNRDPKEKIHNCQIIHYTRRDPQTGKLHSHLKWMRSILPPNMSLSRNTWFTIEKHLKSNEDLLKEVEKIPRILNRVVEKDESENGKN